jgi:hypothetical protein
MQAIDLLKKALQDIGADGLYSNEWDEPCGCNIDALRPCDGDPSECMEAKKGKDDLFYPIEDV